ncbi:MAG: hypothetical protein HY958_13645 [Bacteroidia bacterium]|nr:hypothetical protein [Bacteroidia bacterium]
MKKIVFFSIVALLINISLLHAQAPQSFKYQAIARNGIGEVIANQAVSFKISILEGSSTGTVVYSEEHAATTNIFGLVNLTIGNGNNPAGNFSTISWGTSSFFIKIEMDPTGCVAYTEMGTSQLLSVPYALFAASGTPGPQGPAGNDGLNGQDGVSITTTLIQNDTLYITLSNGNTLNAGYVVGPQGLQGLQGTPGTNGIGIMNTFVQNDSLFITLSSGSTVNAGHVRGPQGLQGIAGTNGINGADGINGINGTDGKTILSGTVDPTSEGLDGDFYINTSTNIIFGPKSGGAWGTGTSLIGPAGTYTPGTGIDLTGGVITNTAPDQTVSLLSGSGITVSGINPSFTVAADFGTIAGTTAQGNHTHTNMVTGTGANNNITFWNGASTVTSNNLLSWDNSTNRLGVGTSNPVTALDVSGNIRMDDGGSLGAGKVMTSDANGVASWQMPAITSSTGYADYIPKFVTSSSFDNSLLYQNGTYIGLGTTTPVGRFVIQGSSSTPDSIPLFEIKDNTGSTVFVVWPTGAHFYVKNATGGSKAQNRGSFAVSGKSSTKTGVLDYFNISPDSTNIAIINPSEARIVWFPKKEAFLAGRVLVESPDSIGYNSMSIGYESKAKGNWSQAFGYMSYARGDYSTAIGKNAVAKSLNSFAFGDGSQSLNINAYAFGQKASALGMGSFAFGSQGVDSIGNPLSQYTTAYDPYSAAFGLGSQARGMGSFALGTNCTTNGTNAFAAGLCAEALNQNAIAIGAPYTYLQPPSTIIENHTKATGMKSIAVGFGVVSSGIYSMAFGYRDTSSGLLSTSMGYLSNATGNSAFSIGMSVTAQSLCSTVFGTWNIISGDKTNWIPTDPLFVIGNGTSTLRSNALTILKNGFTAFNRASTTYPIQVGNAPTNGNGAYLSVGGAWTNGSSREFKDRFKKLDKQDILSKIETMDLQGWYYKETNEYHIWPFAEDFYDTFGTGDNNNKDVARYLSAADVAGVGLVAVQELIKQNETQQKQIEALQNENKSKNKEIDKLKAEIESIKLLIGSTKK